MSSMSPPPPRVLALLVADVVHRDDATGKFSLLGVYSDVLAAHFPTAPQTLHVYLAITDLHGDRRLGVRVVDADESAAVAFGTFDGRAATPLVVAEFGIGMTGVMFPRPGEYRLQVMDGADVLAERRVGVQGVTAAAR